MAKRVVPIGRNGIVNGFADELGSPIKMRKVAPRTSEVAKCPKPRSRTTIHDAVLQIGPRPEDVVTRDAEFRKKALRISMLGPHWKIR